MRVGHPIAASRMGGFLLRMRLLLAAILSVTSSHLALAEDRNPIQFDVFPGYDGIVPEASWFPLVCEVKNDGPSFTATVEVEPGNYSAGQTRQYQVELPTGTLKRFVLPVFCASRGMLSSWDVRLFDSRGKVRAENANLRARKVPPADVPLIGELARTPSAIPPLWVGPGQQQADFQPAVARLLTPIFPDNPLVLEGMTVLYLNSEKAVELRASQVNALYDWLLAGGHLVVAVEQPGDVNATAWLKSLLPCEVKDVQAVERHAELQSWIEGISAPPQPEAQEPPPPRQRRPGAYQGRPPGFYTQGMPQVRPTPSADAIRGDLGEDAAFETNALQVATCKLSDGQAVVTSQGAPLIVTARRGRGHVTALLFSPEREPMRSWKNLPAFWSRVVEIPKTWSALSSSLHQGGWSSDGIFGAMLDTRQVHKLPIEWLLLLLVVYLVVIGPLDQFWLKRIGKPMLTWITFPSYVVFFSLLIYFIGYRLRAGESEWNELHLVDVLLNGDHTQWRGRTYASVYSPSNQRYTLKSDEPYATLRSEFVGSWSTGDSGEHPKVQQLGDGFQADVFVQVWTSQLLVADWLKPEDPPLLVSVSPKDESTWSVKVENHSDKDITEAHLGVAGWLIPLGDVAKGQTRTFEVSKSQGVSARDFVLNHGRNFQDAVMSRQRAFGSTTRGHIDDLPGASIAASLLSDLSETEHFLAPHGLDVTAAARGKSAVLFAWAADYSPIKPLNQFTPRRLHKNTLWRVAVPL